jgi:3-oxoacyl-[acyl-carrier-protein] synthase-3
VKGTPVRPLLGIELVATGESRCEGSIEVDNDDVDRHVQGHGGRSLGPDWTAQEGLSTRRWTARPGEEPIDGAPRTEDLLVDAADAALSAAGVSASDVDVFVTATTTPSRYTSSMATVAGGRLGIRGMAMDVRAGCPSALHALLVAAAQLNAGSTVAVVVAAETLSRVAPATGPLAYVAGDAAAATVLVRTGDPHRGILGGWVGSNGQAADLVGTLGALPPQPDALDDPDAFRLHFGEGYQQLAADAWSRIGAAALEQTQTAPSDVTAFIANQAGRHRVRSSAAAAGVPEEAIVHVGSRTANAGSASFMVALHEAQGSRDRSANEIWMLASVGGGLSYGALLLAV